MNDKNIEQPNELLGASPVVENQTAPETIPTHEQESAQPDQTPVRKDEGKKPVAGKVLFKTKRVLPQIPQLKDPVAIKIEKILESGLGDEYAKLSPVAKQEFKIKGEETTLKISELLKETHIKVKLIFALIIEWLKVLPGINKFFLEQEAKIKTDLILELHKKDTPNNNNGKLL